LNENENFIFAAINKSLVVEQLNVVDGKIIKTSKAIAVFKLNL